MSIPDEIYVNPKKPEEVEFGQSIVAPLSGDQSASYIKTNRKGDMTHYIETINPFPLQDYKCMPGRAMESGKDIRMFNNQKPPFNTNDSDAFDYNNVDSYGLNLVKSETLITTPSENPPSVSLEFFDYSEIQVDFDPIEITYMEFRVDCTPTDKNLTPRIYTYDEILDDWNRQTSNIDQSFVNLPELTLGQTIYSNKFITPVTTGSIRLRMLHTDSNAGVITHKLRYILTFGVKI